MNKQDLSWSLKVNSAMRDLYDLGERIQFFPILLGETARQIRDNPDHTFNLKVDKIEWGIFEKNMTAEIKSLFKTYNFKENEKGYEYEFEGVPVQIYVIKKHWRFLDNLDMRFYKTDEFRLPNPFKAYWPARYLVGS